MSQQRSWVWRVGQVYAGLGTVAGLYVAVFTWAFYAARLGDGMYWEFVGAAADSGTHALVFAAAPLIGVAIAFACGMFGYWLFKHEQWALVALVVVALVALWCLYYGDQAIHSIEGVYYSRSDYAASYKLGAIPAAVGSAAYATAVAVGLLLQRRATVGETQPV